MKKMTAVDISNWKKTHRNRKIVALTAYDFPLARLVDKAGVDIVLVGDSLGMVCLGYPSTVSVTMTDMILHTKAASRGVERALLIADMPFGSYRTIELAVKNAKRLIAGGAQGVKAEGGERVLPQIKALIKNGIPVMGHVGMTPQTASKSGGYRVQGKTEEDAKKIMGEAKKLERAGVFAIVLECVPYRLAANVTKALKIPTIGIGAGPYTSGQVIVIHDLLGFESSVKPRFVRKYSNLDRIISRAVSEYRRNVLEGCFPSLQESYK